MHDSTEISLQEMQMNSCDRNIRVVLLRTVGRSKERAGGQTSGKLMILMVCGVNFMGVYICQNYSSDILFCTFFKIKVDLHCCTHFCSIAKRPSPIHLHSLSYVLFHHGLCKETRYISPCYTAGSHCLSIQNVKVCT